MKTCDRIICTKTDTYLDWFQDSTDGSDVQGSLYINIFVDVLHVMRDILHAFHGHDVLPPVVLVVLFVSSQERSHWFTLDPLSLLALMGNKVINVVLHVANFHDCGRMKEKRSPGNRENKGIKRTWITFFSKKLWCKKSCCQKFQTKNNSPATSSNFELFK